MSTKEFFIRCFKELAVMMTDSDMELAERNRILKEHGKVW